MSMACKTLFHEENNHGISSILGLPLDGHCEKRLKTEYPLRRTLSADMSSKRFLSQSCLKKVASSEEISTMSNPRESGEDDESRPSQMDIWSSIQSQKPSQPSQPYVHPLTRRSSSSLSIKSLEMCTESLGSETGSDVCTMDNSPPWLNISPPPSPLPPSLCRADEHEEDLSVFKFELKEFHSEKSVNYNCTISRRSPPRSFPPPLPSLSRRDGGPCLHMKPHRQDGRLVLEAVAAPSHNYLHAERQGGRLLLSFISTNKDQENGDGEEEEKETGVRDAVETGESEEESEAVNNNKDLNQMESQTKNGLQKIGFEVVSLEKWKNKGPPLMEVHRSLAKLISQPFVNLNPWAQKKVVVEEKNEPGTVVGRNLSYVCFNAYECSWKEAGKVLGKVVPAGSPLFNQELARDAAGLAPTRCHNEPQRTQQLWILERHCVATT